MIASLQTKKSQYPTFKYPTPKKTASKEKGTDQRLLLIIKLTVNYNGTFTWIGNRRLTESQCQTITHYTPQTLKTRQTYTRNKQTHQTKIQYGMETQHDI